MTPSRLLFTGPFHADHRARLRDALCERLERGARDVLVVVASGTARRAVERDLLARRGAVFGVRVVTLQGLPAELARRARRPAPRRLDAVAEQLLAERATRLAAGGRFAEGVPIAGLAARALRTIDALEREGATPEALERALAELQPTAEAEGGALLIAVWRGLARWREALAARRGRSAAEVLAEGAWLAREVPALLDGLDVLALEDLPLATGIERSMLSWLIAAMPGSVVAAHGCAPQLLEAPAARALEALRRMAAWEEVACDAAAPDWRARLLAARRGERAQAADEVAPSGAEHPATGPTVVRLEGAGDLGEVRLAARIVRRHLDAGVAPADILLVAHSAARYQERIGEVFGAAGIAVDAAPGRTVDETAIGRLLLDLLDLAIEPGAATRDRSLAVARAPHLDLSIGDGERLARDVIARGRLGLDDWDALALRALGPQATNRVNRLRRALADARAGFATATSAADAAGVVRRMARELRLVGNAYFARRRVAGGDAELEGAGALAVREDNAAWEEIEAALDDAVPALLALEGGDARGAALVRAWRAMLERVMRATTVVAERASADAVRVAGTGPGSDAPARVTIVLGLLEGTFPRQPRQDPFLRDDVRRRLRERTGWVLPTSDEQTARERECFVRALGTARERLYLSSAITDAAGKPAVRSFYVDDVQEAVGRARPTAVERAPSSEVTPHVAAATTLDAVLAAAAHDVWQHLPSDPADVLARERRRDAAFGALGALERRGVALHVIRTGRRAPRRPVVEPALFEGAPHRTLELSASQLDLLGHCTYRHFVQKVLDPKPIVAPQWDALSRGALLHEAFMEWATSFDGWRRGEDAIDDLRDWIAARVLAWTPAERADDRARQLATADFARLEELLTAERALAAGADVAQPTFAELAFGPQRAGSARRHAASREEPFPLQLTTSEGEVEVRFTGSIDRVDTFEMDGVTHGVILDYKTGATAERYGKALRDGTDLQLRLYALVLERFWGIVPVGMLYVGFGDGVRHGAVRADVAARVAGIDGGKVLRLEPEEWTAFVRDETPRRIAPLVERLARLDIVAEPRDGRCWPCEFGAICRYDRWSEA